MNRITFITPPSWPDPPAGYLPEPGWRPDPSWGPAPAGFQFYRDPFGFPTPPPPEYWQPWASTDWDSAGTMPVARVIEEPMPGSMISTNPAPTRRKRRWVPWLVGLVLLGLVGTGGWFGWQHWKSRPSGAPADVTSIAQLYDPPLPIGTAQYQFVKSIPVKVFEGEDACVAKANTAVGVSKEAVASGTDRGWAGVTWRYADTASAQKGWDELVKAVDGCTPKDYKLGNPAHSPKADQRWVQYDQTAKDGADHGRVVITTDANTVTYVEGGRTDMGETAFSAIRKRLGTLK